MGRDECSKIASLLSPSSSSLASVSSSCSSSFCGLAESSSMLFEEDAPSKTTNLTFDVVCIQKEEGRDEIDNKMILQACISTIDDIPGALQSGHYLWPGALTLAHVMVDAYGNGGRRYCRFGGDGNNDDSIGAGCGNLNEADGDDHYQNAVADVMERWKKKGRPRILELGAGCGLGGVVGLQLAAMAMIDCDEDSSRNCVSDCTDDRGNSILVAWTDRDHGTLRRARSNHEETMLNLVRTPPIEEEDSLAIINTSSFCRRRRSLMMIPFLKSSETIFDTLIWGDVDSARKMVRRVSCKEGEYVDGDNVDISNEMFSSSNISSSSSPSGCFDLILGSDLIYSTGLADALLLTVSTMLLPCPKSTETIATPVGKLLQQQQQQAREGGTFLLTQSFRYEDDVEDEIDASCERYGLKRTILRDDFSVIAKANIPVADLEIDICSGSDVNHEFPVKVQTFVPLLNRL